MSRSFILTLTDIDYLEDLLQYCNNIPCVLVEKKKYTRNKSTMSEEEKIQNKRTAGLAYYYRNREKILENVAKKRDGKTKNSKPRSKILV